MVILEALRVPFPFRTKLWDTSRELPATCLQFSACKIIVDHFENTDTFLYLYDIMRKIENDF